jgi:hypothetical protein
MNMTNSAGAFLKSADETVRPSASGNEKLGAWVPSGNMVLGVLTMKKSPKSGVDTWMGVEAKRKCRLANARGEPALPMPSAMRKRRRIAATTRSVTNVRGRQ